MTLTTVDIIVRRALLEKSMPIHWYAEYLFHACSCLRELTFDTLKIVNTVDLPVNNYMAVDLPSDFVDDVGVAIPVGGVMQNIPKDDSINPLRIHNTSGEFVPYTNNINNNEQSFFGYIPGIWFWNFNSWGEPTGRYFGAPGGARLNGYKVVKERRQIQLTQSFTSPNILLMYISDGQSVDAATQVDTQAFSCIRSYIDWKSSVNAANEASAEGLSFKNQRRILRARLNDLTIVDLRQIIHRSYIATMKN